ncbi:hypothetical protein L1887_11422 [Cichorium endivia]|nr:hypothetical protein L1887_11422 [Cichorium endivia]
MQEERKRVCYFTVSMSHIANVEDSDGSVVTALAKLEEEKESGLKHYQESLERLSKLESEISHAQEASSELAN